MRTLKKSLSLVLVLVLCFGLVGSAFAGNFDDFTDADKVSDKYKEAVDVLIGLKIVEGDAKMLTPQGNFTRAQVAKIAALIYGGPSVANLKATTTKYADVPLTHWANTVIAYCDGNGLVEGYGDGNFGPDAPITGQQAAALFARCLGYGVNKEFSGSDWVLKATSLALKTGIYNSDLLDDGANSDAALTREMAMQMAFNTMTEYDCFLVEWRDILGQYVEAGTGSLGQTVNPSWLSENYSLAASPKDDDFGVGGHVWKSGKKTVSNWYQDDTVIAEYTDLAALTSGELYKLDIDPDYLDELIINGTSRTFSSADKAKFAGSRGGTDRPFAEYNGATLTILDSYNDATASKAEDSYADKVIVTIEYLGVVTAAQAETDTKEASITVTVYDVTGGAVNEIPNKVYYGDDYDITDIAKGDYVLIVPSADTSAGFNSPISIKEVAPMTASVTAYDVSKMSVTFGGVAYGYSAWLGLAPTGFAYAYNPAPASYDFFVNSTGDVIGVKVNTSAGASLEWAYVGGVEVIGEASLLTGGAVVAKSAKAALYYMDGTSAIVDLAVKTATKNIVDGTGVDVIVGTADATTITKGSQYITIRANATTTNYYGIQNGGAGVNTTFNALANDVYSFTKSDDGVTLSKVVTTTSTPALTATAYDVDTNYITFAAGSPAVNVNGTTKYATSATKLVGLVANGTATTVTGYANFKTVTYTVGSAANQVDAIVTITSGTTGISQILVIDAPDTSPTAASSYGLYLGLGRVEGTTQYYNFLVNGAEVSYPKVDSVTLTPRTAGGIFLNDKNEVTDFDTAKTYGTYDVPVAVTVGDGYVVVSGNIVYTDKTFVTLNITDLATGTLPSADTLSATTPDNAIVVYSVDNTTAANKHVEAVFIIG